MYSVALFFYMFEKVEFIASAFNQQQVPKIERPEIVICGRSNVGKSSFLNSLTGKSLAKVSATPGKTRSINFFLCDNKFYLVDLPGYGYAKAARTEIEAWSRNIEQYLQSSGNIKTICHLIDSRHTPTELDLLMRKLIDEMSLPALTVFTKTDKLKQSEKASHTKMIKNTYPHLLGNSAIYYSSVDGTGRKEITRYLSEILFGQTQQ